MCPVAHTRFRIRVRHQGRRSYVFFWVRIHPLFRSWVRIGIGPTHFLTWVVYYCVCIQHDIDKSQVSFIELCKTLRTNSGLRANNSCIHLFTTYKACFSKHCFVAVAFKIFISPADCGVWTHPHIYTDLHHCPPRSSPAENHSSGSKFWKRKFAGNSGVWFTKYLTIYHTIILRLS